MSDSAGDHKKKSIKIRLGSGPNHSPSASRAGSPAYGSRAGSPAAVAGSQAQGQQQSMLDIYPPIVINLSGHFLPPCHIYLSGEVDGSSSTDSPDPKRLYQTGKHTSKQLRL